MAIFSSSFSVPVRCWWLNPAYLVLANSTPAITRFSTNTRSCSFLFNVTAPIMGDIFAERLRGVRIAGH